MTSRLKSLCTYFYSKVKELIPKGDLPYILCHYRNVCFCPLPFNDLSVAHWLLLLFLFLSSRAVAYSRAAYYIFFRFGELSTEFTGDQSNTRALAYIDVFMWLLLYLAYIPADLLLLSKSFHKATRVLFYRISEETKNIPKSKSGRRSMHMLPFNETIVQVSLLYFLINSVWPEMDAFTQIYARLPAQFQNSLSRLVNWFFVSLTIVGANMCISFLLVFPPCLAYWIGEVLEIIADDLPAQSRGNATTCDDMRQMIQRYTNLFMAVREVNKLVKFPILLLHATLTIQQMAETFTMLTVRDSGLDSGASLFIDIMLSFSRIAYNFYALTYLTRGMGNFEEAIRIGMFNLSRMRMQTRASTKDLKEVRQRIRCITAIQLSIGPYALEKDIALQGSFFYINNYATAALWPRD